MADNSGMDERRTTDDGRRRWCGWCGRHYHYWLSMLGLRLRKLETERLTRESESFGSQPFPQPTNDEYAEYAAACTFTNSGWLSFKYLTFPHNTHPFMIITYCLFIMKSLGIKGGRYYATTSFIARTVTPKRSINDLNFINARRSTIIIYSIILSR
jgi:hypothetical protein